MIPPHSGTIFPGQTGNRRWERSPRAPVRAGTGPTNRRPRGGWSRRQPETSGVAQESRNAYRAGALAYRRKAVPVVVLTAWVVCQNRQPS